MRLRELLTAIENVSRGKNTTQSDKWRNGTSDKAVDGDYSTTDLDRCATLLSNRSTRSSLRSVAWEVNLGGLYAIVSVTIYNTAVVPGITTVGLQTVCRFCYFDFLFFFSELLPRFGENCKRLMPKLKRQRSGLKLISEVTLLGWRFGVAVTRWSRSTQLLYIEPG